LPGRLPWVREAQEKDDDVYVYVDERDGGRRPGSSTDLADGFRRPTSATDFEDTTADGSRATLECGDVTAGSCSDAADSDLSTAVGGDARGRGRCSNG
jgi:hypothetical protein